MAAIGGPKWASVPLPPPTAALRAQRLTRPFRLHFMRLYKAGLIDWATLDDAVDRLDRAALEARRRG